MLTVLSISSAAFLFIMLQTSVLTPYVNDLAGESSAGIVLSGLIFSLQGISGALAAPFWGMQGQRRGFFKCLIIAMLSASLLYMTLGIPHALLPFAVMQFATGLCLAGISPMINALLVQVTPAIVLPPSAYCIPFRREERDRALCSAVFWPRLWV